MTFGVNVGNFLELERAFKRDGERNDKANIMKLSDGLFLRCSRQVAKEYPEITIGEHIGSAAIGHRARSVPDVVESLEIMT